MIAEIVSEDIVRPMARGQITIPAKIRSKLKIDSNTWLWIRLLANNQIIIEPVKKTKSGSLLEVLEEMTKNKEVLWDEEDTKKLEASRRLSRKRLKRLYE